MRERIGRPSPAMVVATAALVFAMTGSAAAVVSFARNAGAVDGKSAVAAGVSTKRAAGKLVTTRRLGGSAGTIPTAYIDPAIPRAKVFGRTVDVVDNGAETPFTIANVAGFGTLTATCSDENNKAGVEDPRTTVSFGNTSGQTMEYARATGSGNVDVRMLAPNQAATFTINASNTFDLQVQKLGTNVILQGVVRQDGRGTNNARCINYGRFSQVG